MKVLAAALAALAATLLASSLATAQVVAPFVLKDATGTQQSEATVSNGGFFYPSTIVAGSYAGAPKFLSTDVNGTLAVNVLSTPATATTLANQVTELASLATLVGNTTAAASSANQLGTANFAPSQANAGVSAVSVVGARAGRRSVTVQNTGATPVYLGATSSVTPSTGFLLPGVAGASVTLNYAGALYAVTASGAAALAAYELY